MSGSISPVGKARLPGRPIEGRGNNGAGSGGYTRSIMTYAIAIRMSSCATSTRMNMESGYTVA